MDFLRHQLDSTVNENRVLRKRVDLLERENSDLKRSIYELSIRQNVVLHAIGKLPANAIDLDLLLGSAGSAPLAPLRSSMMSNTAAAAAAAAAAVPGSLSSAPSTAGAAASAAQNAVPLAAPSSAASAAPATAQLGSASTATLPAAAAVAGPPSSMSAAASLSASTTGLPSVPTAPSSVASTAATEASAESPPPRSTLLAESTAAPRRQKPAWPLDSGAAAAGDDLAGDEVLFPRLLPLPESVTMEANFRVRSPPVTEPAGDGVGREFPEARSRKKEKSFNFKHDLRGHTAAVYAVAFSPSGRLLASCSFDKTVRIWDMNGHAETGCLQAHSVSVMDVQWSGESELVSASLDRSAKLWDIARAAPVASWEFGGFAQSIRTCARDTNLFVVGATEKAAHLVDRRQPGTPALSLPHAANVNAVYFYNDGECVLTGDHAGKLTIWDIAAAAATTSITTDERGSPISGITVSSTGVEGDEGRYLAVNSYDNVLRVFDRGAFIGGSHDKPLRLLHSLVGHKNANWPIRSSFFGADQKNVPLLATGSADNKCYLFDVATTGTEEIVQALDGHTDRCYSCAFAPLSPILATAGADKAVKIWWRR